MSRLTTALTACMVMVFSFELYAQTPNQDGSQVTEIASNSHTIKKDTAFFLLQKPVESVDWVEKTLEEIVEWLEDESEGGVNVIPRWIALGAEGINNESVVTIKLKNSTVADIMNEILEQLSEDGQLAYRAIDNNLRISTKGDFDRKLYLRVYDVTDFLFRIPDFGQESPQIDLQTTSRGGGGGGGGGQSVFSGGSGGGSQDRGGTQAEQQQIGQLNQLMTMITATIEPQSWGSVQRASVSTGGSGGGSSRASTAGAGTGPGRISAYNRSLIVYNTIEVHEQIAGSFTFKK